METFAEESEKLINQLNYLFDFRMVDVLKQSGLFMEEVFTREEAMVSV